MRALDIEEEQPAELARRLGLTSYQAPGNVKKWLDGKSKPNYVAVMAMLDATGWLQMGPRRRRRRPSGWAAVNEHLEAVFRLLASGELEPGEAQAAGELADQLARLASVTSQVADVLASALAERRERQP